MTNQKGNAAVYALFGVVIGLIVLAGVSYLSARLGAKDALRASGNSEAAAILVPGHVDPNTLNTLGSTLTYSAATGRIELYNFLVDIAEDLQHLYASATANTGSSTFDPGALAPGESASTTVIVSGFALGDFAMATLDSATNTDSGAWVITTFASTTGQVGVNIMHATTTNTPAAGTAINLGPGTLSVLAFPNADFGTPVARQTATTSTP